IRDNQVFLRDFDSTNGTFLNEEPVKGEVPLKNGDLLKVGPLNFKVEVETAAAVTAPTAKTKPTPPPPLKRADIMDDDAAAMLLDLDSDAGVAIRTGVGETENAVPDGTTLMDLPAVPAPPEEARPTPTKL